MDRKEARRLRAVFPATGPPSVFSTLASAFAPQLSVPAGSQSQFPRPQPPCCHQAAPESPGPSSAQARLHGASAARCRSVSRRGRGPGRGRELAAGPYQVPVDVCGLEVEGGVEQLLQPARDVVLLVVRHRLLLQLLQVPSDPTAAAAAFFPHGRRLRASAGFRQGARRRPFVARQRHEIPTPRSREASCPPWKEPLLSARDLCLSHARFVFSPRFVLSALPTSFVTVSPTVFQMGKRLMIV